MIRKIGDAALTLLAGGGVLCIVLLIASVFLDVTLLMFRTGSMEPTISTGDVAIARQVPASEVSVGDVVSVERPGALPVTHRVIEVDGAPDGSPAGAVEIVMQGDANQSPDPYPYVVTEVDRVLFSVPWVARLVAAFGNPWVLGGITLAMAALVTWAFWPKDPDHPERRAEDGESESENAENSDGENADEEATEEAGSGPGQGTSAAVNAVVVPAVALPVVTALLVLGPGAVTPAAAFAPERFSDLPPEHVTFVSGDHLEIVSIGDPEARDGLVAAAPVAWQVGVTTDVGSVGGSGEVGGELDTRLALDAPSNGTRAMSLRVSVDVCDERWVDGICLGGGRPVTDGTVLEPGTDKALEAGLDPFAEHWYRVEVTLPAAHGPQAGGEARLRLHASALGEEVGTGTPPEPTEEPSTPGDEPSEDPSPSGPGTPSDDDTRGTGDATDDATGDSTGDGSADDGGADDGDASDGDPTDTRADDRLPMTGGDVFTVLGPGIGAVLLGLVLAGGARWWTSGTR
ncbi:signal peptidase I [Brevibacterium litoralis]|uniref:signal peptidase I n=1 Tax=Brevibacterium litoralis TaxID=3138935 RepID=UPI0032F0282B